MNLPDLIKRSDRSVKVLSGQVQAAVIRRPNGKRNVVLMEPGSQLVLLRSDEFECLRSFPGDIGWKIWRQDDAETVDGQFTLDVIDASNEDLSSVLFSASISREQQHPVLLNWPAWPRQSRFHLSLQNVSPVPLVIDCGLLFNSRSRIFPRINGTGVEIGPGLRPQILASDNVDVRYVESSSAEQWVLNYKKSDKPSVTEQQNLWSKYIVADAQTLSTIPDGSLDFIYSNHVFEHLMNPLGVLENWRRKLKASGIVAGVVPDCRYIFDLRQAPTTVEEWLQQRADAIWQIGPDQYARWCKNTAPYNTPEDLIARKYSIHVHFYTPLTFAELGRIVAQEGLFSTSKLETSENNRDFGFVFSVS